MQEIKYGKCRMPQLGCGSFKVCGMLWSGGGDGVASNADSAFEVEELQVQTKSLLEGLSVPDENKTQPTDQLGRKLQT